MPAMIQSLDVSRGQHPSMYGNFINANEYLRLYDQNKQLSEKVDALANAVHIDNMILLQLAASTKQIGGFRCFDSYA